MAETDPVPEYLQRVRADALRAFPECGEQIVNYIRELSELLDVRSSSESDAAKRKEAASTLLCKLEDYLESVMVGNLAKRAGH